MEKLRLKDLIDFRRRTDKRKITFKSQIEKREKAAREKKEKKQEGEKDGGDYWVSCVKAIEKTFKENNKQLLENKIKEIQIKLDSCNVRKTQLQYQANIDILHSFEEFDLDEVSPPTEFEVLHQSKSDEILLIKTLPIKANPTIVFSFQDGDFNKLGCISFIAQKGGFKNSELGIFCEANFRYLEKHYSDKYKIDPTNITVVDAVDIKIVRYNDVLNGDLISLLDSTIDEINYYQSKN
jgi:hypothetical protein